MSVFSGRIQADFGRLQTAVVRLVETEILEPRLSSVIRLDDVLVVDAVVFVPPLRIATEHGRQTAAAAERGSRIVLQTEIGR